MPSVCQYQARESLGSIKEEVVEAKMQLLKSLVAPATIITLFDIPCKLEKNIWSPNTVKARSVNPY